MNTGYKGKIIIDVGAVYAPYNPFENITWQKYLQELQLKYASWTQLGLNKTGDGLSDATEMMREKYPGNYHVIEKYDSITGKFVLKLEFTDHKEEIFWLLKWA
jgi:hypothetical protein